MEATFLLLLLFSFCYSYERNKYGSEKVTQPINSVNTVEDVSKCLTSPSYPEEYPDNSNEIQTLSVEAGQPIEITFLDFDLEYERECSYDYLEFLDENSKTVATKMCGESLPQKLIISTSTATAVFHSDASTRGKGYKFCYKPANFNPEYMKVSSTGEASTKHSELMGIYSLHEKTAKSGFPVWKKLGLYTYQSLQKYDAAQYLFVGTDGYWGIGNNPDSPKTWIYLPKKDPTPESPEDTKGWNFWDDNWKIDNQVIVEALTDCEYRYSEVPSRCICRHVSHLYQDDFEECSKNGICVNKGKCFNACELWTKIKEKEYCYCKDEATGDISLIGCMGGNMCTTDGHCHFAYEVSGVPTKPITGMKTRKLWIDSQYTIVKMPEELINSILFQPEMLVSDKTIELSSPNDATVFLALDEDEDGGLLHQANPDQNNLEEQGWRRKDDWEVSYGDYCDCDDGPAIGHLQIWSKDINQNEKIQLEINGKGAKFVIFFSTDCEEFNPESNFSRVPGNCFCKGKNVDNSNSARHCKTGQGCKDGSCFDNIRKMIGRK